MATKIIIERSKTTSSMLTAINGKDMYLEVNGERVDGEIELNIHSKINEVVTASIVMILPEIEYRDRED